MNAKNSNWPTYKQIKLPYNIFVGKNVLEKTPELTREYSKCLVVTGKKTAKIAGNRVADMLGCETFFVEESSAKNAETIARKIKNERITLALAVGGGKIIDTTKLASFNAGIEYISIPTNCSNDGIASPMVTLKGKGVTSVKANPPLGVIADIDIIRKSPPEFISAGFGDAIAKFSAVKDWQLGHVIKNEYFGDYASALSLMIAKITLDNAIEIGNVTNRGINILLEALISSGAAMGIADSSRPASGSEHKFSHALDMIAEHPSMHGFQCGVGTIIMTYLHGENWENIRNALKTANCPVTAKQMKMDKDLMVEALMKAKEIRPERYTIIDHLRLDRTTALNALESTGVV